MTDPGSGFQQAAGELGGIKKGNDQLQQQISDGQLRMNPETAEEAAKAYEKAAQKVDLLISNAGQLEQVRGLGDYPSGKQLAQKFALKARNGQTGASDLLGHYSDELRRKADLFRDAAKAYRAQEDQIAGDMKKGVE